MKVLLFGATGMVGQGVLRECLQAADVTCVQIIGRTPAGRAHPKLREIVRGDLFDYRGIEEDLEGFDACFFCLGASSQGMAEEAYVRLTYDLTLAAAQTLVRLNPGMTFVYVTGAGTDGSEQGRVRWARIKGRTENALLRLPFKAVYLFRPGAIQPLFGARSKTPSYRVFYALTAPLLTLARYAAPKWVLTTQIIGEAMLNVVRHGAPKPVLEAPDIYAASKRA